MIETQDTLNELEAGKYLGISAAVLRLRRCESKGPRYLKAGKRLERQQRLDPALTALVLQARDREQYREFAYAALALVVAALSLILVLGGFVYLVMQGRPTEATILLGAGVLELIASLIRTRLSLQGRSENL